MPPIIPPRNEWGDGYVAGWCDYQEKLKEKCDDIF